MARNPRVLFAAGAVAAAAVAGGALALTTGGDGASGGDGAQAPQRVVRAELMLEQARIGDSAERELIVSLKSPELNRLEVNGGQSSVALRCVDLDGAEAVRTNVPWPLLEEAGFPPHTHQPVHPRVVGRIRSCRMRGPGVDFAGSVPGRPPLAQ